MQERHLLYPMTLLLNRDDKPDTCLDVLIHPFGNLYDSYLSPRKQVLNADEANEVYLQISKLMHSGSPPLKTFLQDLHQRLQNIHLLLLAEELRVMATTKNVLRRLGFSGVLVSYTSKIMSPHHLQTGDLTPIKDFLICNGFTTIHVMGQYLWPATPIAELPTDDTFPCKTTDWSALSQTLGGCVGTFIWEIGTMLSQEECTLQVSATYPFNLKRE